MNNDINLKIIIDGKESLVGVKELKDGINSVAQTTRDLATIAQSTEGKFIRAFDNVRVVMMGVREAMNAVKAVAGVPLQKFIDKEQAEVAFGVLLKGTDKAQKRMEELADFAKTTPFELREVVSASRQLEVLTKGALSTGDGLRLVGDIASGTGTRIDELSMWMGRLYDGIKGNKAVGEAMMRLQELGAVSGETRTQIEKLEQAGMLSTKGWAVLTKEFGNYKGMMEKQSLTTGGQISNLNDSVSQLQTNMGGFLAVALKPMITSFTDLTGVISDAPKSIQILLGAIGGLGGAFLTARMTGILPWFVSIEKIAPALKNFGQGMRLLMTDVTSLKDAVGLTQNMFGSLMKTITVGGWITIGATALTYLYGYMKNLATADKEMANSKAKLIQADSEEVKQIKLKQAAFTALSAELTDNNKSMATRKNALSEIQKVYPNFLKNVNLEAVAMKTLTAEVAKYNDEFLRRIELKIREKNVEALLEKKMQQQDQIDAATDRVAGLTSSSSNAKKGTPGKPAPQISASLQAEMNQQANKTELKRTIDGMQSRQVKIQELNEQITKELKNIGEIKGKLNNDVVEVNNATQSTVGEKLLALNNEITSLENAIKQSPQGDSKLQGLIKTLQDKKAERDKLQQSISGEISKSSGEDNLEVRILKASSIVPDKDHLDVQFAKYLEDISSSEAKYNSVKDKTIAYLKTNSDRIEYLDKIKKQIELRLSFKLSEGDRTSTVALYEKVVKDSEVFNSGLLASFESQKKALEVLKTTATTDTELLSYSTKIELVEQQISEVEYRIALQKNQHQIFKSKLEEEHLQKLYEKADSEESAIKILKRLTLLKSEREALEANITDVAEVGSKTETNKQKEERNVAFEKMKVENSKNTQIEKDLALLKIEEETKSREAQIYINYEEIKTQIQLEYSIKRQRIYEREFVEQNKVFGLFKAGYSNLFSNIFNTQLTGSEKMMSVWTSMRDFTTKIFSEMLESFIEKKAIELFVHNSAEVEKTAVTVAGSTARKATLLEEIGTEIANAGAKMLNTLASIIEWNVATFGPFAALTIPAEAGVFLGMFQGFKSMLGFEHGGIGIVGERGPEIFAPVSDYSQGQALLATQTAIAVERALSNRAPVGSESATYGTLSSRIRGNDLLMISKRASTSRERKSWN